MQLRSRWKSGIPARVKEQSASHLVSSPLPATQEALAGTIERVTFHNAENGFCVLRAKARGHRDLVAIVGHAAVISAGEWITATGVWVNDRTHGQQFQGGAVRLGSFEHHPGKTGTLGSFEHQLGKVLLGVRVSAYVRQVDCFDASVMDRSSSSGSSLSISGRVPRRSSGMSGRLSWFRQ
jgi:hypothetical protein